MNLIVHATDGSAEAAEALDLAIELANDSGAAEVTLCELVDELIGPYEGRSLLTTTGTQGTIAQLAERTQGLEQAIREIALEVQSLSRSR